MRDNTERCQRLMAAGAKLKVKQVKGHDQLKWTTMSRTWASAVAYRHQVGWRVTELPGQGK
ncbi:unnamed protein product [Prunus armeniaca]|uniref:Uncharacterized protein n=1 Tax=Prunus armeniaca TaxID=36596 RepID=A0A6J5Y2J6_PRUAR|nr:unnamed protein product [Prunus armeniaca]